MIYARPLGKHYHTTRECQVMTGIFESYELILVSDIIKNKLVPCACVYKTFKISRYNSNTEYNILRKTIEMEEKELMVYKNSWYVLEKCFGEEQKQSELDLMANVINGETKE
jgi:hypothetical protein